MRISIRLAACVAVAALVAGCSGGESDGAVDSNAPGPLMKPGENCLSCHRSGGQASRYVWSAAGTVYPASNSLASAGVSGASVEIVDAAGKRVVLTTNRAGNFYTAEALKLPTKMAVVYQGKRAEMPGELNALGACNACHSSPDPIDARGRIRLP
jgi:hypothetical protein